ncbi:amino acid permease [Saliphagus infecundisoli]|uniref:Amino acid permease n=1 Tax=Saliphagus infecundisoli TaxID=1849069 RepID=A0ABD5QK02_9EURY|nr:amino acid permease [Saliphagus infecundisoli]
MNQTEVSEELSKDIGLLGALAIGIGTMIAAGVFVLSGLAVGNVGAMAIVSFVLAAIVAALTAAAYAEFSSIYHESGGGYMYANKTFDTDLTYIMGWTMILGYPASAAFYIASFAEWFFQFVYPALNIPAAIPYWVSAALLLAVLVWVNVKGTEESIKFQIVFTALKVLLLVVFLYGGFQTFDPGVVTTSFAENADNLTQIGLTSALVFITFFGFSAITTNAEEIQQPERTIPRSIYLSMGVVVFLYTLVVLVVVLAVNDGAFLQFLAGEVDLGGLEPAAFVASHGELSMGLAAQYYMGPIGFWVIIGGALISMLSAANATILAGSRVKLAMARRNHLPSHFGNIHPSLNTPYKTVLMTGGLIAIYLFVFGIVFRDSPGATGTPALFGLDLGIEGITSFANALLLTGLTIVNVALIFSRRRSPDLERGFEVPLVPWLPAFAVVANVVLLFNLGLTALVLGLIAEAVGVVVWFTWIAGSSTTGAIDETKAETPMASATRATESDRDYQLLVPIANPDHVDHRMETALDLAADTDGEILVMSVATVPEQTPLEDGRDRTDEQRAVVERSLEYAADSDVPISGTIRIGHHVDDAILHTIDQYGSDGVLMGWRGRKFEARDVVLGSNVDTVLTEATCDVFIDRFHTPRTDPIDSILLPVAGGPHGELAVEAAGSIARTSGASVHAMHVFDPDDPDSREDGERYLDRALAELEEGDVPVETGFVEGTDVAETIIDETEHHDLTIIGATREGLLQRLVLGNIPQTVGEGAYSDVLMVKRNLEIGSRLKRWYEWVSRIRIGSSSRTGN